MTDVTKLLNECIGEAMSLRGALDVRDIPMHQLVQHFDYTEDAARALCEKLCKLRLMLKTTAGETDYAGHVVSTRARLMAAEGGE